MANQATTLISMFDTLINLTLINYLAVTFSIKSSSNPAKHLHVCNVLGGIDNYYYIINIYLINRKMLTLKNRYLIYY